jgi:hypothetical protein
VRATPPLAAAHQIQAERGGDVEEEKILHEIPVEAREAVRLAFLAIQSDIEVLHGEFYLRIARAPVSERVHLVEKFAYEDWESGVKHLRLLAKIAPPPAFEAILEQLREVTLANLAQLTAKVPEPKRSELCSRVAVALLGRGRIILSGMLLEEVNGRLGQLRTTSEAAMQGAATPGPTSVNYLAGNLDALRMEAGLSYRGLSCALGKDDHGAVSKHCKGERLPEKSMIYLYARAFSRLLARPITAEDLCNKNLTRQTSPNVTT